MTTTSPIRILVVSDDPARPGELEQLLGDDGASRILLADTANAVARVFESDTVDLIVVYPHRAEPDLLEAASKASRDRGQSVPIIAAIEPDDSTTALAVAAAGVEGFVHTTNARQFRRILVNLSDLLRSRQQALAAGQRLDDIEDRYTLLLESSSEAIAYLHEGLHIFANPAYLELFGFESFGQLEGLSMLDLLDSADHGPDLKQVLKALNRDELPSEPLHLAARREDGNRFTAVVAFSRARYAGEACAQMLVREDRQDASPALAEELNRLKQSDLLTGLLNQSSFRERIEEELATRADATGLSVLLMSIDQPDRLQSRIGIGGTDALICQAGAMLSHGVGEQVAMARLRDHIFAVLAETPDTQSADALARRIVEHCHGQIVEVGNLSMPVTVSVGLTLGSSGQTGAETLISQADIALSEALRSGGNAYVRYRPRISAQANEDDLAWHERLIHALDRDEIRLMTSPITSMDDDASTIYEIDSRMRAEGSDEVLLPAVFLAAAARVGLAPRLDRDLLRRLAQVIADRPGTDDELWMVTLSSSSIEDAEFCDHLNGLLSRNSLPPDRMIWAFRDIDIQDQLRQAQEFIQRFRRLGCRFALSDVVADSSFEATLRFLELDYLQLAPEMVQNLGENEPLRQQLADIARESARHKVRTIAPKVEHTSDLATLWQIGITLVQGDFVREQASI